MARSTNGLTTIRTVQITGVTQAAVDAIINDNFESGEGVQWNQVQSFIDSTEQAGESRAYSEISSTGIMTPISESAWKGGTLSGSFEYVGGYKESQSPSHTSADIIHAPYFKGQISGAIEATSTQGSVIYFAGTKSGSNMSFPLSGSALKLEVSGTHGIADTDGLIGRVKYDGGGFSGSGNLFNPRGKYISGQFPGGTGYNVDTTKYVTSSNVSTDDIAAFTGSIFTGSVIVGNKGKLEKCYFDTGTANNNTTPSSWSSNFSSNPGNYLSASIEIGFYMGEANSGTANRVALIGGDFTMSGSVHEDETPLITRILRSDVFVVKTDSSGSIASPADGSTVTRKTKKKGGVLQSKNYHAERNLNPNFTKTIIGKQSKASVDAEKNSVLDSIKANNTGSLDTGSLGGTPVSQNNMEGWGLI